MDYHMELDDFCGFVLENFCIRADFPVLRSGRVNLKSESWIYMFYVLAGLD